MPTQGAIDASFENVQNLVYKIVHDFKRQYNGSFDDLLSEAHEHYVRAYQTHDDRSSFSYWIQYKIWRGLLETKRQQAIRARLCRRQLLDLDQMQLVERFDLGQFLQQLSDDAATAVQIVLDPPRWIQRATERARNKRRTMQKHVKAALARKGWNEDRIEKAFQEVREALT